MSTILFLQRVNGIVDNTQTPPNPETICELIDELIKYEGYGLTNFHYQAIILFAGWINRPEYYEKLINFLPNNITLNLNSVSHFFCQCSNSLIKERIGICIQNSHDFNRILLRALFREANQEIILYFIKTQVIPLIDYYDAILSESNQPYAPPNLVSEINSLPEMIITSFKLGKNLHQGQSIQRLLLSHPELF